MHCGRSGGGRRVGSALLGSACRHGDHDDHDQRRDRPEPPSLVGRCLRRPVGRHPVPAPPGRRSPGRISGSGGCCRAPTGRRGRRLSQRRHVVRMQLWWIPVAIRGLPPARTHGCGAHSPSIPPHGVRPATFSTASFHTHGSSCPSGGGWACLCGRLSSTAQATREATGELTGSGRGGGTGPRTIPAPAPLSPGTVTEQRPGRRIDPV